MKNITKAKIYFGSGLLLFALMMGAVGGWQVFLFMICLLITAGLIITGLVYADKASRYEP